jgi:hypothetical protein
MAKLKSIESLKLDLKAKKKKNIKDQEIEVLIGLIAGELKLLNESQARSIVSAATLTPNADSDEIMVITAQGEDLTIANPVGTPKEGQAMLIRIKDDSSARAISFGAIYRQIGTTLPTTTVIDKTVYIGIVYNAADTKWDVISVNQEA